jgi:hypothetical protein
LDDGFSLLFYIGANSVEAEIKWSDVMIVDDADCLESNISALENLVKHLKSLRGTHGKE